MSTKAVLVRKSRRTFRTHKPKAPLCIGSCRQRRLRDCPTKTFSFYNPSVSLARATSLYTREAHYRLTVHLKSVTHYTLRGKRVKKDRDEKSLSFYNVGAPMAPFSPVFIAAAISGGNLFTLSIMATMFWVCQLHQ